MSRKVLISSVIGLAALAFGAVWAGGLLRSWASRVETLTLPGTVQIQEVHLGPRVSGRVLAVLVQEGDLVEAGQQLVRLDAPDLEARVARCRAAVDLARARLEEARNGPRAEEVAAARAVVEAAEAKLDLLRAGARPEEIERAKAELAASRAELWNAERELERRMQLALKGATTAAELDLASSVRDRLRNRVAAAQANLDLFYAGTRVEEVREAEARLEEARAKLALFEAGTRPETIAAAEAALAEAQAQLDEAEVALREAIVTAPERAVVEVVAVRPGDLVQPNQPVVVVLRASDLWVKAFVPETELGRIRLGQEVRVTTDSYPDRPFLGKIVQIASISEFTPRNVQSPEQRRHQVFAIKVRVEDPGGVFKAGMAAEVTVPLEERREGKSR